ncbi:MAG: sialate O-acetylesterase [Planctomycetota bacterium]|nr:sialate O-acetylesterase [Planctomycetota bacterium]
MADVRLPHIFSDHMVLQQQMPIPVWGDASPGEAVTVTLAGRTEQAVADPRGRWMVRMPPLNASARQTGLTLTVSGKNTIAFKDVLIGEVWVCSGESNMQWSLAQCDAAGEVAAASLVQIRLFTVPGAAAFAPQEDCGGAWAVCSPETVRGFSAVGFFFGSHLHENLKVPVGLINASCGATIAEAWTSGPALRANLPEFNAALDVLDKSSDADKAAIKAKVAEYDKSRRAAFALKEADSGVATSVVANYPSLLYNGMIHPLTRFGIRGAVWYQGESNIDRATQYHSLLPTLIADWRARWGRGDFPFLIVQLPNALPRNPAPEESGLAALRESQAMTAASTPSTGLAVTIDLGDADDIHPKKKQDVGLRLGLLARATAYGQDLAHSGPVFKSMAIKAGKAILTFDHLDNGLVVKGDTLRGFAVCGADKKFVWAEAHAEGDEVVVSSAEVSAPVAVRYNWANNPDGNLFNTAGLPAAPFRTDGKQ